MTPASPVPDAAPPTPPPSASSGPRSARSWRTPNPPAPYPPAPYRPDRPDRPRPARHRLVRLRPRSTAAVALVSLAGVVAFGWPLLADPGSGLAHSTDAPLVFALVLPLLLAVVLAEISEGGLDVKAVAMLGVLSAVGAALRPLGAGTAGLETVFFLLVLGGRVFGAGFGFVLGATTLFASALLTGGVGPWLPFQMLGAAWVGWGAGLLPRARGRVEIALLAGYGALAGLLYGLALNLSFWPFATGMAGELSFVPGAPVADNLRRFLVFSLATSLGWDIGRALTNAVLISVTGRSVLGALRRAARRAAFDEPVSFEEPVSSETVSSETVTDARERPPGPRVGSADGLAESAP
ncbi:MAG: ECF transporter S component [Phycicoccus sp.]